MLQIQCPNEGKIGRDDVYADQTDIEVMFCGQEEW